MRFPIQSFYKNTSTVSRTYFTNVTPQITDPIKKKFHMNIELHYYQEIKSPTIPAIYLKYIHHKEPLKSEGARCIFRVIVNFQ